VSVDPEFGAFLRARRQAARISVRRLAEAIGVSHVYLSEVERGKRAPLPRKWWPRLIATLPGISEDDLERAMANTRPLQLDLRNRPQYQDLARALARRIERDDIDPDTRRSLLRLLDGEEER